DSAWKDVLDAHFPEFLHFFFPHLAKKIDWSQGFDFLDKELQAIATQSLSGRRMVDKLIRVRLLSGEEQWLLLHIEIQGNRDPTLQCRVFEYYYRLRDRYQIPILTLVILTDRQLHWRPDHYEVQVLGKTILHFQFHMVKLWDYRHHRQALEETDNPFGTVVLAQLAALTTRKSLSQRFNQKMYLTKLLYQRGWNRKQVLNLYKFIDWVLTLPEELAIEYNHQVHELTEEKTMAYITTAERIGMQKGREEGIQEGIQRGIQLAKEQQNGYITTAERIGMQKGREEGIQEGIQRGIQLAREQQNGYITTAERIGMQKGRQEGEYLLLLRLLERKFHSVPESRQQQLRAADPETLLQWGERILEAHCLEDVFAK
ncbi:MAG: hypothetical protein A3F18_08755, partial [Legionellales bacterium RIFCSPHIGHO2_12_FULL_37_14]